MRRLNEKGSTVTPNTSCSVPSPSTSSGCVVILEPGAPWPERAFAKVPYRDGVVVLGESSSEPLDRFITRLNAQCALMAASGVSFRAAIVACNDDGAVSESCRGKLALDIAEHVLADHECLVFFVRNASDEACVGVAFQCPTAFGRLRALGRLSECRTCAAIVTTDDRLLSRNEVRKPPRRQTNREGVMGSGVAVAVVYDLGARSRQMLWRKSFRTQRR
jgi:hypothetical protein